MQRSRAGIVPLLVFVSCVGGGYVASPGRLPAVPTTPDAPRERTLPGIVLAEPVVRDSSFWTQDIDSVRTALSTEIERALLVQRRAWIAEEFKQHLPPVPGIVTEPESQRAARVHCHRELLNGPTPWSPVVVRAMISSGVSRMSLCPEWIPRLSERAREASHEYTGAAFDVARVAPFPRELISALDSARRLHPAERFFVGQLVRVLTENHAYAVARDVLAECNATDGWCSLLAGYVAHASGDHVGADSTFMRGIAQLDSAERCEWYSVERLLPDRKTDLQSPVDCNMRKAFAERFWWLADPMISKPGNERRAEHHARVVRNHLVSQLTLDAHYNLRPEKGLDAIVDLRIRYGWPDHQVWGGGDLEKEHNIYLMADAGPPYSSPEYALTATATVPSRRAANNPLTTRDADFELTPNVREPRHWWPHEHVRLPRGSMVAFREPQYVLLRRSGSARLLLAADLRGGQFADVHGARVEARLMASTSPGEARELGSTRSRVGERIAVEAGLTKAELLSFEAEIGVHPVSAARTRFGVASVPTIETIGSGRCAVSKPIFLTPSIPRVLNADALLSHMLGTLALEQPEQVGVAWESYGFTSGDTTTIAITVTGHTEIGAARSMAMRLGIAGDPRRPIGISWREPDPTRSVQVVANTVVPTALRSLIVNVGGLTEGRYSASVSMQSAKCKATSEMLEFSVWR